MLCIKVVHSLKVNQLTQFHSCTLTGENFASTSEVLTSAIFERSRIKKV